MKKLVLSSLVLLTVSSAFAQQRPGGPGDHGPGRPGPGPIVAPNQPGNQNDDQRRREEEQRRIEEEQRRQEEERRIEEQRRQEEERRLKAQNAEADATVYAVGANYSDCYNNAVSKANLKSFEVINACQAQAEGLMTCFIVSNNVIDNSLLQAVQAGGHYEETKSNEATCRSSSAASAEGNAVNACQDKFGTSCQLTGPGVVTSARTEDRKRYLGWFGPHDTYNICDASASALPYGYQQASATQCAIQLVAKTHY
ncbi:MAG TPA: hypothetical protein VN132_15930 [Bdellovibrio sp.]|nr:hypothetical protein [Bdellovibrio sp.]